MLQPILYREVHGSSGLRRTQSAYYHDADGLLGQRSHYAEGTALMASEHGVRRLTATVRGYVQGVGYRYYVLQHARALGLTGFARNERDDSVTVVAEGQASLLVQLTDALRRGPEGADVQDVQSTWGAATGEYPTFRIAGSTLFR